MNSVSGHASGADGLFEHAGRGEPYEVDGDIDESEFPGGEDIDGVAVVRSMRGADGVRVGVGSHLRNLGRLRLGEARVGHDARDPVRCACPR